MAIRKYFKNQAKKKKKLIFIRNERAMVPINKLISIEQGVFKKTMLINKQRLLQKYLSYRLTVASSKITFHIKNIHHKMYFKNIQNILKLISH